MEHENAFAEPLNGPLWYLPAILIMHVTIDLCRKTRHQHTIMILLCIISFVLYAANKYWYFAPNLTPMGLMRNLPYYYIGYLMGQYNLFKACNPMHNSICGILCFAASILLFDWHLDAFYSGQHMLHIVLFYPVNVLFFFGVLNGCKVLNGFRWSFITNLSKGTLIIIGLHIILVTIFNYALKHLLNMICYYWYTALPTALVIIVLLYPIILWAKHHSTILLGKKSLNNLDIQ